MGCDHTCPVQVPCANTSLESSGTPHSVAVWCVTFVSSTGFQDEHWHRITKHAMMDMEVGIFDTDLDCGFHIQKSHDRVVTSCCTDEPTRSGRLAQGHHAAGLQLSQSGTGRSKSR